MDDRQKMNHFNARNLLLILILVTSFKMNDADVENTLNQLTNKESLIKSNGKPKVVCASPEVLVNGSPSPDILDTVSGHKGSSFSSIEEIQFVGIIGPLEQKRICKIKCINGVWVGPLCALQQDVRCAPITSNDSNRIDSIEGNKMHDRARFSCVDGYFLDGFDDIVCTPNGYWSYPPPTCRAIRCPDIKAEDPLLRIQSYKQTYGSKAYFSCPAGYIVNGDSYVQCLKNNSWSGKVPKCTEITCAPPLPPANGRLLDSGQYRSGDYIQYFCNKGFVLVGESLSICLENGTWSKERPTCKRACEFPGEPDNGYIVPTKFHYNLDEVISIVCRPNHRLVGSSFVKCETSGHWSGPLPLCRPLYLVSDS